MNRPSNAKETGQSGKLASVTRSKLFETNLVPDNRRSDIPKGVREPIFGESAAPFLGELVIAVVAFGLILTVLLLAASAKEKTASLLFGRPPLLRTVP
jgi:hypothetical protein